MCCSAGHHLLNVLLIPILKASAPSRIVCTASCFHDHANGKEGVIAYDDLHFKSRKYDPMTSYAQSSKNPSGKAHLLFHSAVPDLQSCASYCQHSHDNGLRKPLSARARAPA